MLWHRQVSFPAGFARIVVNLGYNPIRMLQILLITIALGSPAISLDRTLLRWDFANIIAAAVLLTVTVTALGLFLFRRKARDLTLVYIGLFCLLYSVRLLATLVSFQALFDVPRYFWNYLNWGITCTIVLPLTLFLNELADVRLRKFLKWTLVGQVSFSIFGIIAAALGMNLTLLFTLNNLTIFAVLLAVMVYVAAGRWQPGEKTRASREFWVFVAGFVVWMLFVVQTNLPGRPLSAGHNIEFVGFLIFVGCLAYVTAFRTYASEEQLLTISKELEIARRIQFSTLPQSVPALRGLEIAARYVPMSAVAGDFYDFLLIDENRLGVLVADVTGHGVPAALIASMLKVAFAAQADHAENPAAVLTGLNRALCGKFEEHFVTAAYLFIDLQSQRLAYSAAGHPAMLLLKRDASQPVEIEQNGLMLGLFPEADYSETQIEFAADDRCLLYTDGILEASNAAREEFGKARAKESLQIHRDLTTPKFADALARRDRTLRRPQFRARPGRRHHPAGAGFSPPAKGASHYRYFRYIAIEIQISRGYTPLNTLPCRSVLG